MKKSILMVALMLGISTATFAQNDNNSPEDRAKMRAEMVQKQAERLAKDFDLKNDAKSSFIETFTKYQNELASSMEFMRRPENEDDSKKNLSEEEATAKIQESFDRQEKQIAAMQKRLEIQKNYYAEFAKTLTPQQMVKIFAQQRRGGQQGGQQGGNRQGGNRDGFGGGNRGGFGGGNRGGFGGGFGGPGGF